MPEPWRQPFASSEAVQRRMSAQRREGTRPELALRRELHGMGLRYRLHLPPLAGLRRRADVVFVRDRVAVFVDGCFWHGCPEHGRRHYGVNGWYWPDKIGRNQDRDRDTASRLQEAGWAVVRIWEHDLGTPGSARSAAEAVRDLVLRRVGRSPG